MSTRILALCLGLCGAAYAGPYQILDEDPLLAIVIHKEGIAAAKAHNHIIVAPYKSATLDYTPDAPEKTQFSLAFPVSELAPDAAQARAKWSPVMIEKGVLEEPFEEMPADAPDKIRKTMLGPEQLDAEKYPDIKVTLKSLEPKAQDGGEKKTYTATFDFTLHGKTVEGTLDATLTTEGERLHVKALGAGRFTQFGIKPFSAMAGTMRNKDEFTIVVQFTAAPAK
ncbi:MAG: YceI family protein [Candidatus Hydrogenedentes bacterium]|nr:YceI family protein [Candidatus Hydrogenedentota bacterium]MBI3118343.1 YceI family protein [Candidatus Hydrogenedentota bacterium]